jgi:hypothetical protein
LNVYYEFQGEGPPPLLPTTSPYPTHMAVCLPTVQTTGPSSSDD